MSRLGIAARFVFALVIGAALCLPVCAQDNAEDLAKDLSNPVASLISIPIQLNYDAN